MSTFTIFENTLIQTEKFCLCHKLKFYNPFIVATWWWKPLIFQTFVIFWNKIYSLKYLRSTTLGSGDIGISKSEFFAKTRFFFENPQNFSEKSSKFWVFCLFSQKMQFEKKTFKNVNCVYMALGCKSSWKPCMINYFWIWIKLTLYSNSIIYSTKYS